MKTINQFKSKMAKALAMITLFSGIAFQNLWAQCDTAKVDSIKVTYDGDCTFTFEAVTPQHVIEYTWFFGDSAAMYVSPVVAHSYTSNGTYQVELIYGNLCSADTLYTTVTCNSFTGINPLNTGNSIIHIFPNPATGMITVQFYAQGNNTSLRITDLSGRLIRTKSISVSPGENEIKLNVSRLASGMYFLEIENNSGFKSVTKFVKK